MKSSILSWKLHSCVIILWNFLKLQNRTPYRNFEVEHNVSKSNRYHSAVRSDWNLKVSPSAGPFQVHYFQFHFELSKSKLSNFSFFQTLFSNHMCPYFFPTKFTKYVKVISDFAVWKTGPLEVNDVNHGQFHLFWNGSMTYSLLSYRAFLLEIYW